VVTSAASSELSVSTWAASEVTVTVSDDDPSASVRPLSATFSLAETTIPVRSKALKPACSTFNV
jgi:hypothetical protein